MVSYFVSYRGASSDPEAFLRHYSGRHAEILKSFPGLRGLVLHTPVASRDPFPVNPGGRILLAQMQFDSAAALDAALASEARARARADFGAFPPFDGTVTHQAMGATVLV
jgi:uncharacterized protein (TIGR02118 family)